MQKVTLKQIADIAGTSIGTVDRALNNRGRINPETKQHILDVANELGYRPNKLARNLKRNKTLQLGILYPKYPTYFFDEMTAGVEHAIQVLADYNIEIHALRCDFLNPESQIDFISKLDFQQFDGFILNAGGNSLLPYINKIVESGIPVATFNSDIRGSKRLFHVGVDPYLCGRMAGELMGKILNGTGDVLILSGFPSVLAHTERVRGFVEFLQDSYPDIHVVGDGYYMDKDEKAKELTTAFMKKYPSIQGIYSTSTPGAIGAGEYLAEHAIKKQPIICGYDITPKVCEFLKKDLCSFTIYQNPAAQAYYSLILMANYLMDDILTGRKHKLLLPQIVLKENVEQYLLQGKTDLQMQLLL